MRWPGQLFFKAHHLNQKLFENIYVCTTKSCHEIWFAQWIIIDRGY